LIRKAGIEGDVGVGAAIVAEQGRLFPAIWEPDEVWQRFVGERLKGES
jgi:hypothetical protein